jgi:hypothetical protein
LTDSAVLVRDTSAHCLSALIPLQPRLDPLLLELVQAFSTTEDKGIKEALLEAIYGLLCGVIQSKKEISPASKESLESLLLQIHQSSGENDDSLRKLGGKCFGAYLGLVGEDKVKGVFNSQIFSCLKPDASWTLLHSSLFIISGVLRQSPSVLMDPEIFKSTLDVILLGLNHDKTNVSSDAVSVTRQMLTCSQLSELEPIKTLSPALIKILSDPEKSVESRRESILVFKHVAKVAHSVRFFFELHVILANFLKAIGFVITPSCAYGLCS